MKKYLYAGLLSVCLAGPALAATGKFVPESPDEPLRRRSVLLCMAVVLAVQAFKYRPGGQRRRTPSQLTE